MEVLVINSGNFRDPLLPVPGYLVCGPLGINTGRSFCGILAKKVKGFFTKEEAL